MSSPSTSLRTRWRLGHEWSGRSDLAALALCRAQLAQCGIDMADAERHDGADALKMHGMEIADARRSVRGGLLDLSEVAARAGWAARLPPIVTRYMRTGEHWHGIPMGIHQANVGWVNAEIVRCLGLPPPFDIEPLREWLERAARHIGAPPLALGAQPWQVGVVLESVVLAVAGPELYRRAFIELCADAWEEAAMLEALRLLFELREFVDDEQLGHEWTHHLTRVRQGQAALLFMGDWVRADSHGLAPWNAGAPDGRFVAVMDYFVPLASAARPVAERVALALTDADFQRRFAQAKGCLPAVGAVCAGALPSFTFDQCCLPREKHALLHSFASHFIGRSSPRACAAALGRALH